jgi:hypothetical protein
VVFGPSPGGGLFVYLPFNKKHKLATFMNNTNQSPEVKTKNITLGSIIGWLLGIGSVIAAFTTISSNFLVGLLYILLALILIPPVSGWFQSQLKIKLSKSVKVLLFLIIIFIIGKNIGTSPTVVTNNNENVNTEQQKPTIKVTATKMIADYKANEVAADATYKGNMIEVTGQVSTIGKDIADMPYITLTNGEQYSFDSIQCMFTKDQESELAAVVKGKTVTLSGKVSGKLGNVIVRGCSIVK